MKTFRNPPAIHPPLGSYSHQVEVDASERWLVMSGQVGRALDGSVPEDPLEQIKLALENIRLNLAASGMGITDIVKLTWFVVGAIDTEARRETVAAWLQGHQPASTLIYVAGLAAPSYRVEVDAWACQASS